jgi:ankyrin repeat protein
MAAATANNSLIVALLLQQPGIELDNQDGNGYTALHRAALTQDESSVALLLEAGANYDLRSKTGLSVYACAVANGQSTLLPILNKYGVRDAH